MYFETYSAALEKVFSEIRAKGFDRDEDAPLLPARPKVGETTRINERLYYKGRESGIFVHIQIYNRDNQNRTIREPYELNYYYSFVHTQHFKLTKAQFKNLIDFLDSDISMYDSSDMDYFEEKTGLSVDMLMDYYGFYGLNDGRIESLQQEYKEFKTK